jgi:hypothetical protein
MRRLYVDSTFDTVASFALPFVAFLAALLTAFLSGCGDNLCSGTACGARVDGGPSVPFAASSITFVADEGAGPGAIHLQLAHVDLQRNAFALRVVGDGLTAFGVAGRLTLRGEVARIDGATVGGALAGDGVTVHGAAAATPGGVMFGFTRAGTRTATRLSPDLGIGNLAFTALGPGATRVEWAPDRARALDGALQPVEARWIGGTLVVE